MTTNRERIVAVGLEPLYLFWRSIFQLDFYTMILLLVNNHDIQETFVLSLSKSPHGSCRGYAKSCFFFTFDGAFLSVEAIPLSRGYYTTLDMASIEII